MNYNFVAVRFFLNFIETRPMSCRCIDKISSTSTDSIYFDENVQLFPVILPIQLNSIKIKYENGQVLFLKFIRPANIYFCVPDVSKSNRSISKLTTFDQNMGLYSKIHTQKIF